MDYEKKYKEALERAKKTLEKSSAKDEAKLVVEYFFPELAESEDERIRKWILEYLYDGLRKSDEQFKEQFKTAIAWFEKQKEQKPAEWGEEDEKIRGNLMSLLANMRGDRITEETYQKYYPWLKSLRPSWKPSEEQMKVFHNVLVGQRGAWGKDTLSVMESLYEQLKAL